jgi:hypothetical protein
MKVSHQGTDTGAGMEDSELRSMGNFMVGLVTMTILLVFIATALEVHYVLKTLRDIHAFASRLSTLNRADPPANTPAFYAIQVSLIPPPRHSRMS